MTDFLTKVLVYFVIALVITLTVVGVLTMVFGVYLAIGYLLLFLHTSIHPASVFAGGNVLVYAGIALVLSWFTTGRTVIVRTVQKISAKASKTTRSFFR